MRSVLTFVSIAVAFLPDALAFWGKSCRIMPLGASITYGYGSSQKNGYRDNLYTLLERDGNTVDMVGNNPAVDSTFKDKDTEGWPSFTIDRVADKMRVSMPEHSPNIVTLLVGTNDMKEDLDLPNAPARLGKLVDGVLSFPPRPMIVVSSLPPNSDLKIQDRIDSYNAALPGVVQERADTGKWVLFADCGNWVDVSDLSRRNTPKRCWV